MGRPRRAPRIRFLLPLLLAVACSALLFHLQYRYDNKYTGYRPTSRDGVMWLNNVDAWGNENLLLHLVDGWELYQDKLLTPAEIAGISPDAYLFLGQYGGLNLADRTRLPYGDATYRTTVVTDGVARTYALELPEIYSASRVWVNGVFMGGKGDVGERYRPETGGDIFAFSAADRVEIVIQVSDHDGYYSGMVHPPAFGAPRAVQRALSARLAIHAAAWVMALLLGVFCLVPWQGWSTGGRRQLLLALFCLFFLLYSGYPLTHSWRFTGALWYGVERACRQMMTVCLLLITGELCGVPRKLYRPAAAAGMLVGLLVLYPQLLFATVPWGYYFVGAVVRWWHRLAAALLVGFGVWGLWRRSVRSTGLLAAALIFAQATVMSQVYYHEPIVGGWLAETAGFLILLLVAGILRGEARAAARERVALREHRALLEARVDLQLRQAEQEREYVERVHALRHESQNHYALLGEYLEQGHVEQARAMLRELRGRMEETPPAVRYCGNPLVNSILSVKLAAAQRMGAAVEWTVRGLPETLPIADRDLMTALANILDNALEALEAVPAEGRWLSLSIVWDDSGILSAECRNPFRGERDSLLPTTKADPRAHGLGLGLIREVADRYGGVLRTEHGADAFCLTLVLNAGKA